MIRRRLILTVLLLAFAASSRAAQDAASNLAVVIVSTGYDDVATSIVLTTGHGARLPTAPYNCAWYNATDYPGGLNSGGTIDPNYEVVRVTSRATDTLTVTRAQESTSASTKNTGGKTYVMQCGLTAARFTSINDAVASSFVTIGAASGLASERALTGTSNQITVTDNGAGSSVVLSTPQNLHTAATPTFGGETLNGAAVWNNLASANIWTAYDNSVAGAGMILRKARGTSGTPLRAQSGDTLAALNFRSFYAVDDVTTASASGNVAYVRALTTEAHTSTAQGTSVVIGTTPIGSTTVADRLSITNTGVTLSTAGADLIYQEGPRISASSNAVQFRATSGTPGWAELGHYIPYRATAGAGEGGSDTYAGTFLQIAGKTDTGNNYFGSEIWLGPTTNGTTFANAYALGVEGKYTGTYTERRFWLFDATNSQTVFFVDGAEPDLFRFQPPGGAENGIAVNIGGRTITTNADLAVGGASVTGDYEKNNTNTRTFRHLQVAPTFNFGGSNTNTTINVLDVDTINTATTGATINLINARYGGAARFSVSSAGAAVLAGSITAVGADLGTDAIQSVEIAADQVTYAKIQDVAANSVLARAAGTSGDVSAVALSASNLLGRGSTGDVAALTVGKGLSISGTVVQGMEQSKTFTIESPGAAENFGAIRFNQASTITKVVAVLQGSSTPSVTWQVRHGSDRSAAGTDLFTANKTTSGAQSTTTGAVETATFNDATIAADHFVWFVTTAQSGTVTAIHVTIFYTVD